MKRTMLTACVAVLALAGLAPGLSQAGQTLTVEVDESQMVTLPAAPGAIVVGNPSIVDVSVQGKTLFIHGRSYGQTNLTILDLQGNQIAYFELIGRNTQSSAVTMFKGARSGADDNRYSYSCAERCEVEIQVGDNAIYKKKLIEQSKDKMELATGSKTAEAEAPAAPQ